MGDEKFEEMMDAFGRANAGKEVTTAQFRECAEKTCGKPLAALFDPYLIGKSHSDSPSISGWSIFSFDKERDKALIVYGTLQDKSAQREAAANLARKIQRNWSNYDVPIKADSEVTDADLKGHHLLLIGRPETNAVTARLAKGLPITFGSASFVVRGETYAHAGSAIVVAGSNLLDPRYSIVVYAGLGAEATWQAVQRMPEDTWGDVPAMEALLMSSGHSPRPLVISCSEAKTTEAKKADEH